MSPAYLHALGFIGCRQQSCPLKLGQGIDEAIDRDPPFFVKGQLGVNARRAASSNFWRSGSIDFGPRSGLAACLDDAVSGGFWARTPRAKKASTPITIDRTRQPARVGLLKVMVLGLHHRGCLRRTTVAPNRNST